MFPLLLTFVISIYSTFCRVPCLRGQGICLFNQCYCLEGFYGEDCSEEFCKPGCMHGSCVDNEFGCDCLPGWEGELCNIAICSTPCTHGDCTNPGECNCDIGWGGEHCERALCTSCKYGDCWAPDQCSCWGGFAGAYCDVAVCDPVCGEHGYCWFPTDKCVCEEGWAGALCDVEVKCMWPYSGEYPDCEIMVCNGMDANLNGVCGWEIWHFSKGNCINGECECCCGWTGHNCLTRDSILYEECKEDVKVGWCLKNGVA